MKKGTFNIATHQEPFRAEHTAYKAVAEVYDTEIPILIYKPIGAHGKPYGHWEVVEYYTGKQSLSITHIRGTQTTAKNPSKEPLPNYVLCHKRISKPLKISLPITV